MTKNKITKKTKLLVENGSNFNFQDLSKIKTCKRKILTLDNT